MKLKNLLHTLVVSGLVSVGIIASYSSTTVASTNLTTQFSRVSRSSTSTGVDAEALEEASVHLDKATNALKIAESAKDAVKEGKFFQAARNSMAAAVDAVDAEAIAAAADAVDEFTDAVEAAYTATNEEEEKKYIDAAQAAIEDLRVALAQVD